MKISIFGQDTRQRRGAIRFPSLSPSSETSLLINGTSRSALHLNVQPLRIFIFTKLLILFHYLDRCAGRENARGGMGYPAVVSGQ